MVKSFVLQLENVDTFAGPLLRDVHVEDEEEGGPRADMVDHRAGVHLPEAQPMLSLLVHPPKMFVQKIFYAQSPLPQCLIRKFTMLTAQSTLPPCLVQPVQPLEMLTVKTLLALTLAVSFFSVPGAPTPAHTLIPSTNTKCTNFCLILLTSL